MQVKVSRATCCVGLRLHYVSRTCGPPVKDNSLLSVQVHEEDVSCCSACPASFLILPPVPPPSDFPKPSSLCVEVSTSHCLYRSSVSVFNWQIGCITHFARPDSVQVCNDSTCSSSVCALPPTSVRRLPPSYLRHLLCLKGLVDEVGYRRHVVCFALSCAGAQEMRDSTSLGFSGAWRIGEASHPGP